MLTEIILNDKVTNENIRVQVIRSGRKSLGLEVRPDGTVLARIPARLSDRELKAFIEKQQDWILKKVDQVKKRADARTKIKVPSVDALSDAEIQKIKDKIADRVKVLLCGYAGDSWAHHDPQPEDQMGKLQQCRKCEF